VAARPPATLACSCLDAAPCSGPSASGICSGMQTHSRGGRYRVPNTQVTVIPVPMAEHGRAAKAAAEPRAPITVVAAATAAPAASGAAAAPAAAPAPAPAAALDGRGRAPFDTEPERAARRDERGRKPALYHRKVVQPEQRAAGEASTYNAVRGTATSRRALSSVWTGPWASPLMGRKQRTLGCLCVL